MRSDRKWAWDEEMRKCLVYSVRTGLLPRTRGRNARLSLASRYLWMQEPGGATQDFFRRVVEKDRPGVDSMRAEDIAESNLRACPVIEEEIGVVMHPARQLNELGTVLRPEETPQAQFKKV